ncbi:hypothetical protein K501DRAFT_263139 [Backusella circina FSU 941]|nr:hypothetical protein K501DRAFT_263139 [Backusella circina FSU 941]
MYKKEVSNRRTLNSDWRRNGANGNDIKRSVSPSPDRRPISTTGKNVASLQQQWLMQQQQHQHENDVSRSNSHSSSGSSFRDRRTPDPILKSLRGAKLNEGQMIEYDDDEEDDDIEEECIVVQDTRARSPSINRGSGGSVISVQPQSFYPPQEFKIVREGWLYKKGTLQWKQVYAVAKHGNAVKAGGLYLYKDEKLSHHLQTYDMSEVLEVSPKAQDYKQGLKWEICMRVNRDDVILATDDMLSRKDWVESLSSIMGKFSIATQNQLQSRIQSSEMMNRDLQLVAEDLNLENTQLKEQIEMLTDAAAKKERQFQQEIQQRESELNLEMTRLKQKMETKCELIEKEANHWRTKCSQVDKTRVDVTILEEKEARIEELELEVRQWRLRVDDLEHNQKQMDLKNASSSYRNRTNSVDTDHIRESMSDVKYSLRLLQDKFKESDMPIQDIKSTVTTLCQSLEEAKLEWSTIQGDIVKFLTSETDNKHADENSQRQNMEVLRNEFDHLREELVGITSQEDNSPKKEPSLCEKFDIVIQMIENMQLTQSYHSPASTGNLVNEIEEKLRPNELFNAISNQDKQLGSLVEQFRDIQEQLESVGRYRPLPSPPNGDFHKVQDEINQLIESAMRDIIQSQQDQEKQAKIIEKYLQMITKSIEQSAITDLPGLSGQLEEIVERLSSTEQKLSQISTLPSKAEEFQPMKNMPPVDENDKLGQFYQFVKNTETFMKRALFILHRYGDDPTNIEEIIRRSIKGVSKNQLEEIYNIQKQNKQERSFIEKRMQQYEANARGFFDKSMEKIKTDLTEITGVMYEMLERLVIQSLEQVESKSSSSDMGALQNEKKSLESELKTMRDEFTQLQSDIRAARFEHDRLCQEIQKQKQDSLNNLAKELEPLIHQITKLKKAAGEEFSDDSSGDYVDLGRDTKPTSRPTDDAHLRFPSNRTRRTSNASETYRALAGSRDKSAFLRK